MLSHIVNTIYAPRLRNIERFKRLPHEVQSEQFRKLMSTLACTKYGAEHGVSADITQSEYAARVPLNEYEDLSGYIDRMRTGEKDVLWQGHVKWFAKSSGTTGSKSKYIPVTGEGLRGQHMKSAIDIMAVYCNQFPKTGALRGKMLTLGGSKRIEREGEKSYAGDLSAILIENTPWFAGGLRTPSRDIALLSDFDEKVRRIAEISTKKDVRSFTGVPSWNLVMLNRILEYTGKNNLLEIWENLELFVHGGMDFRPYEPLYRKIIPSNDMHYMETYNASEGFFAMAEKAGDRDMMLMLDYGTYYEFLPATQLGNPENAVPLEGVKKGVNYAILISSCNGLWRYMLGDTVEFTSTDPYKIRISGRTKHFINAFGEELMIGNAEAALRSAIEATGATIAEYTAAPIYMVGHEKGAHEWVIEFDTPPASITAFGEALDKGLQAVNSDYEAKRYKNTTLNAPQITTVPRGTFVRWMAERGKLGGQNKVPRLFNDRTYVEQLKELL